MNGYFEYIAKVFTVLLKIGAVLIVVGVIIYFSLTTYLDYRMKKIEKQEKSLQEQSVKEKKDYDMQPSENINQEQAENETAYSRCLNKAYKDYKTKYDEECSKFIMDGECVVTQEKRYELDGIYMHDKKECEKLKQ